MFAWEKGSNVTALTQDEVASDLAKIGVRPRSHFALAGYSMTDFPLPTAGRCSSTIPHDARSTPPESPPYARLLPKWLTSPSIHRARDLGSRGATRWTYRRCIGKARNQRRASSSPSSPPRSCGRPLPSSSLQPAAEHVRRIGWGIGRSAEERGEAGSYIVCGSFRDEKEGEDG